MISNYTEETTNNKRDSKESIENTYEQESREQQEKYLRTQPPLNLSSTTSLIQNFISSTTRFLNSYVANASAKLDSYSERMDYLERQLVILESKTIVKLRTSNNIVVESKE